MIDKILYLNLKSIIILKNILTMVGLSDILIIY